MIVKVSLDNKNQHFKDRMISETQTIGLASRPTQFSLIPSSIVKTVSTEFDGVGNKIKTIYPSGFVLTLVPDEIDRTEKIMDGANNVAEYKYIGPGARQTERISGNNVKRTKTYDEARRPLTHEHLKQDTTRITGFSYTWDRADNRKYEQRLSGSVTGSPGDITGDADTYKYNSIYQLTQVHYGVPSAQITSMDYTFVNNFLNEFEKMQTTRSA